MVLGPEPFKILIYRVFYSRLYINSTGNNRIRRFHPYNRVGRLWIPLPIVCLVNNPHSGLSLVRLCPWQVHQKKTRFTRSFILIYSHSSKHYLLHLNPLSRLILILHPLVEGNRVVGISRVVQRGPGLLPAVKSFSQLAYHNLVTLHIGVESSEGYFFYIISINDRF